MPIKKAVLIDTKQISSRVIELAFETVETFNFLAGQFISISIQDRFRAYSLCSNPYIANTFSIIASVGHDGIGANYLKSLKVNDEIAFVGPAGKFKLNMNIHNKYIFLCTGTGIAPFISMLYQLEKECRNTHIQMYCGYRTEEEILKLDVLDNFKKTLPNFSYKLYVSKPLTETNYNTGRITNQYTIDKNTYYYVCGNPEMVTQNVELLKAQVSNENIFYEKFTVAGN